jgi:hypothetical protein
MAGAWYSTDSQRFDSARGLKLRNEHGKFAETRFVSNTRS